jgi:hypothetical protein
MKPACSSLNFSSILFNSILVNTLLGTDSNVIPLQLSHICRSPFFKFFGSLTMRPLVQSFGMISLFQMLLKSCCRIFEDVAIAVFNISAWMESIPGDLPFFKVFIAYLISSIVGVSMLISRSSSAGSGLGDSPGSGQLKTSWKY